MLTRALQKILSRIQCRIEPRDGRQDGDGDGAKEVAGHAHSEAARVIREHRVAKRDGEERRDVDAKRLCEARAGSVGELRTGVSSAALRRMVVTADSATLLSAVSRIMPAPPALTLHRAGQPHAPTPESWHRLGLAAAAHTSLQRAPERGSRPDRARAGRTRDSSSQSAQGGARCS